MTAADLHDRLARAKDKVPVRSFWRLRDRGRPVWVIVVALDGETLEPRVVFTDDGLLLDEPLPRFLEQVEKREDA